MATYLQLGKELGESYYVQLQVDVDCEKVVKTRKKHVDAHKPHYAQLQIVNPTM